MSVALGIVAAVVGAVVTDLLTGWARGLIRRLSASVAPHLPHRAPKASSDDHTTIGSGRIRVDSGGWPSVHAMVRCAPSARWLAQMRMERDGMYRLVHRACPGRFQHEADYAVPDEFIRFQSEQPEGTMLDIAVADCLPNGVIEIAVPIPHRATSDGLVIPVLAIAQLVVGLHSEVSDGAYARIYSTAPKRVDWTINISPTVTMDAMQAPWVDLDFPGRRPGGRAQGMRPSADVRGYGREATHSLPATVPIAKLLRLIMRDFLERNGFREVAGAIDDIVATVATPSATGRSVA